MTDHESRLREAIRAAKVNAAEKAAIAGIPQWMLDRKKEADAELAAKGGCPGCGSKIVAVHHMHCSGIGNDLY